MFDFFSQIKRFTSRNKSMVTVEPTRALKQSGTVMQLEAEKKQNEVEQQRQQFYEKLNLAKDDEEAVFNLMLICDFADGRLRAAQYVHSEIVVTKVRNAMRNHDRRVAKLMQSRLDLIQYARQTRQKIDTCIQEAQKLIEQESILANQVTQLDKLRGAVGAPTDIPELLSQYDGLRRLVEEKFQRQNQLQRQALDWLQQVEQWRSALQTQDGEVERMGQESEPTLIAQAKLAQLEASYSDILKHPAQASLPRQLKDDCVAALQACHQRFDQLRQLQQKTASIEPTDHKVDAATPEPVQTMETVSESISATSLDLVTESATLASPVQSTDSVEVQVSLQAVVNAQPDKINVAPRMSRAQLQEILSALEEALEQGSVQQAKKLDRQLREFDLNDRTYSAQQREQLSRLRSELNHLASWAKWSGNVSRDELIKVVEELAHEHLAPNQLAKKITALRERWKEMEKLSGAASQDVWNRFDAACNTAYAPAAQYFQEQAEQRKLNLVLAQQFLQAMEEQASLLLQDTPNWKAFSQFCQNQLMEWKKLGHVDRKHRNQLDSGFDTQFKRIWQPLQQQRALEIQERHGMIATVKAIDGQQRSAVDQLRQVQERWQKQAALVPLKRQDEQSLWEQFRAACDQVFAQRKEFATHAETQRQQNLLQKRALCDQLNQALSQFNQAISDASLHDVAQVEQRSKEMQALHKSLNTQWKAAGQVPKAEEAALEQAFQDINKNAQRSLETWQARKKTVQKAQSVQALQLCWQIEQAIQQVQSTWNVDGTAQMTELLTPLAEAWNALQIGKKDHVLQQLELRFKSGLKLLQTTQDHSEAQNTLLQYTNALQNNLSMFDADLLRLEILHGIDSPAELAKERLHLQVEVLQAALKSGQSEQFKRTVFFDLLKLPVALDASRQARFERLLSHFE